MKTIILLLATLLPMSGNYKSMEEDIRKIKTSLNESLQSGNINKITPFISQKVDLDIESENLHLNGVSKAWTEKILSTFVKKHPLKSLTIREKELESTQSRILVGQYQCNKETHILYLLIAKAASGKLQIQEIRIKN